MKPKGQFKSGVGCQNERRDYEWDTAFWISFLRLFNFRANLQFYKFSQVFELRALFIAAPATPHATMFSSEMKKKCW